MALALPSRHLYRPLISPSKARRRFLTTSIARTLLSTGGHSTHLSFHGPKKHPILDPSALHTLTAAIQDVTTTPNTRILFLRSTIAGADLHHMSHITNPSDAKAFIRLIDDLCSSIQDSPIPVVSMIDGPCLGAGMEVAASCDFRIAVDAQTTIFGMPETRVGVPSVVQACLLPGLMGWAKAREVLYFGETFSVRQAFEWGFINEVVRRDEVDECVSRWEWRVAGTGREALGSQKKLMRVWEEKGCGREGVQAGVEAFGRAYEGEEPSILMGRFLEERARTKRKDTSVRES